MDSGCLIDFDELKVGDKLYTIKGEEKFVIELRKKDYYNFPIIVNNKEESERQTLTVDGKLLKEDKYPEVFKVHPFDYVFQKLNEYKLSNKALRHINKSLMEKLKTYENT